MVKDDVPIGIGYIYIDNVCIMYMLYMFGFDIGFQEHRCDYSSRTQNLCLVSDLRCLVLSTPPFINQGRQVEIRSSNLACKVTDRLICTQE